MNTEIVTDRVDLSEPIVSTRIDPSELAALPADMRNLLVTMQTGNRQQRRAAAREYRRCAVAPMRRVCEGRGRGSRDPLLVFGEV